MMTTAICSFCEETFKVNDEVIIVQWNKILLCDDELEPARFYAEDIIDKKQTTSIYHKKCYKCPKKP